MAKVHESVSLTDDMLENAARWYKENKVPRAFRQVHPLVLAEALRISEGDWRRVTIDEDGSITVHNHPVW